MSRRHLLFLVCVACLPCFVTPLQSTCLGQTADVKEAARNVLAASGPKVFVVKSLVKIEASLNGKQVLDQESAAYGMGTVISDGMLVTSYRSIKPNPSTNPALTRARSRGMIVETEVTEIKLIDESGEEYDAKLVLHDDDLDLAFIAIDRTSESVESWSCDPVETTQGVEQQHLDDLIFLSRLGESMRFQPSVRVGQIHAILKRPRRFYLADKQIAGSASFDSAGKFIGLCIRKPNSGREVGVIIPAKDILKLLPQAIEKAKTITSEEPAEDTITDEESSEEEASDEDAAESKESDSN